MTAQGLGRAKEESFDLLRPYENGHGQIYHLQDYAKQITLRPIF